MEELSKYNQAFENMVKFKSTEKNQVEDHEEEEKKERKKPKKKQSQLFYLKEQSS
tara:strand:+ start:134 stop:298 length:165 start_codon:yes stop_codon:yes gene_type:complete